FAIGLRYRGPDFNSHYTSATCVAFSPAPAGDPSATGNVLSNDTDVDFGDTKTVIGAQAGTATGPVTTGVGTVLRGTYGTVTIAPNGDYVYKLDNSAPDTDALTEGEAASDLFSYTMKDAAGATSTTTLTIHITGSDDAAVVTGDISGSVT